VTDDDYAAWVKAAQGAAPLDYAAFDKTIAPAQVNYGAKISHFTLADPGLYGKVIMAAMAGKTYPVPDSLTEQVDTGAAPASN
jgi:hypothetical protein